MGCDFVLQHQRTRTIATVIKPHNTSSCSWWREEGQDCGLEIKGERERLLHL